jgi:DNA-3-methyladenine glycosylase II
MKKAFAHFRKTDPLLYKVALEIKLEDYQKSKDYFTDLVESIISQQLSGKAANTIFARFKKLFTKGKITPQELIKIPDQEIREAGISFSKIKYIKGIAEEIVNSKLDLKSLDNLKDEEIIKELTKLKGVGDWTAEMFLMFSLARPDIFSAGDLGLKNAIIKLYKLDYKPNKRELIKISEKWSPHRTYASRILWKSLEL